MHPEKYLTQCFDLKKINPCEHASKLKSVGEEIPQVNASKQINVQTPVD